MKQFFPADEINAGDNVFISLVNILLKKNLKLLIFLNKIVSIEANDEFETKFASVILNIL